MRLWYRIKEKLFSFKMRCQRFIRGYADIDVWSMDSWFIELIPKMLRQLKETTHSYPNIFYTEDGKRVNYIEHITRGIEDDNKPEDEFVEWQNILEEMAHHFDEANESKCSQVNEYEDEWFNRYTTEEFIEKLKSGESTELDKKHLKREFELEEYRQENLKAGLDMFKDWFNDLWD